jgi:cytochrome c-type biogenesis protein CcmH/NrfG
LPPLDALAADPPMKSESLVFAAAGTLVGFLGGWIIGSQHTIARVPVAGVAASAPPPAASPGNAPSAPALDTAKVQAATGRASAEPRNPAPRVELGNLYFDAEQYREAARWYQEALAIDPSNADVSTDLGVSFYYLNEPDRALAQFDKSLAINPKHSKTLLNLGIVRAFGKQDLSGAAKAWQEVIAVAPGSPEGQAARRALDAMRGAHPDVPGSGASPSSGPGSD